MTQKIGVITGGLGEIATAMIKQLYKKYTRIIALDLVSKERAAVWLEEIKAAGINNVEYRFMDVTDFVECRIVINSIIKSYGRIDLLVNNAGVTRDAVFYKMTKTQWDEVLRINLDGMFNVTHQVVQYMMTAQSGRIINISSVNGQKGQFSQVNYAASKAGIFGFTKSLAQELIAKNITVNCIAPGYVNTHLMNGIRPDLLQKIIAQIPAKRLAEPEEIAWVVDFLADDRSAYITGATININGGLLML